jgi:hypothetical protein
MGFQVSFGDRSCVSFHRKVSIGNMDYFDSLRSLRTLRWFFLMV